MIFIDPARQSKVPVKALMRMLKPKWPLLSGVHNPGSPPALGEMPLVARDQKISFGCFGTFQEAIVRLVGADGEPGGWGNHRGGSCQQGRQMRDAGRVKPEGRAREHTMVFGQDGWRGAGSNLIGGHQFDQCCFVAVAVDGSRNDDVGVQDNPDYLTGFLTARSRCSLR
jgi:hypothetical protein